jgi:hypothetical protein
LMCTYSLITPSPSHEREIAKESVQKNFYYFFGADSGKTWCKRVIPPENKKKKKKSRRSHKIDNLRLLVTC